MLLPLLALAAINTGDDLLTACTMPEKERIACSAMVTGVAYGAIIGAADAHQKVLCVRPGIRPADLIEAVRKYLDQFWDEALTRFKTFAESEEPRRGKRKAKLAPEGGI